jgi:hypothetical protein
MGKAVWEEHLFDNYVVVVSSGVGSSLWRFEIWRPQPSTRPATQLGIGQDTTTTSSSKRCSRHTALPMKSTEEFKSYVKTAYQWLGTEFPNKIIPC